MSVFSGVIGYSSDGGDSITRSLAFNNAIVGRDSFYDGSSPDRIVPWAGVVETGEEQVAPDGGKSNVMEVWLRSYVSGTTAPDVYVEYRGTDDSAWSRTGDTDATITVTNSGCTGTGCAWSNHVSGGDDITTVFSLPCLAAKATLYTGATPVTKLFITTDYTITGTKQITLVNPLATGTSLYAYWSGTPIIKMKVGDIIETAYGWHRVTEILSYNTLALADYPQPSIASTAGTHHRAQQLPTGEGETTFGINRVLNTAQFRFTVVPRYISTAATNVRMLEYRIAFVPMGERQKKV